MNAKSLVTAAAAVLLTGFASASTSPLPTPRDGGSPDTERSVCVPLPDWPERGRRVKVALSAHTTLSNNVQVSFGKDTNRNGNLDPEEVGLTAGYDCGVWFVRPESGHAPLPAVIADWTDASPACATNATRILVLRQPKPLDQRLDFAKVTIRGRGDPAATLAAGVCEPGTVLFLR